MFTYMYVRKYYKSSNNNILTSQPLHTTRITFNVNYLISCGYEAKLIKIYTTASKLPRQTTCAAESTMRSHRAFWLIPTVYK